MKKLVLAAMVPALLIACSEDNKQQYRLEGSNGLFGQFYEAPAIKVVNIKGEVIANAQVLLGDALNSPFSGNFLTTDQNGQIALPAEWSAPLNITVDAPGYLRATYMNQAPGAVTIQLRKATTTTQYEIKGAAQNLPVEDKDGYIDFGLVMPAFSKIDLLAFNMNAVISPQNDRVTVMGQDVDIPANISVPKQSEKYGFFTLTLDKPAYRVYTSTTGITRIFAARGRFPFKSTVDELRDGKEFYQLVNDFRINGGGLRDIDVQGQTRLDIPTRELNFNEKKEIAAPSFRSDELFMAVGLANQSGYLIPTDVKRVEAGKKMNINSLPGSEQLVLGVLKRKSEMKGDSSDRMSAALLPLVSGVTPTLLPLIEDPRLQNGELLFPAVQPVAGINAIGTYSVLTREEEVLQGREKVKLMNPKWEVYAAQWTDRVKLPVWPSDAALPGKKRWEVSFIGSQTASQADLGPAIIEAATHVTHSSILF